MKYNFDGFTENSNLSLNNAILSAEGLGHTYIGSEHLLLGLLKTDSGIAFEVLNEKGVTADRVEQLISTEIGVGAPTRLGRLGRQTHRSRGLYESA